MARADREQHERERLDRPAHGEHRHLPHAVDADARGAA